jgi:hypothetical protein
MNFGSHRRRDRLQTHHASRAEEPGYHPRPGRDSRPALHRYQLAGQTIGSPVVWLVARPMAPSIQHDQRVIVTERGGIAQLAPDFQTSAQTMLNDQRRALTGCLDGSHTARRNLHEYGPRSVCLRDAPGSDCARHLQVIVEAADLRSLHRNRQWITLLRDVEHQELQRRGLTRVLVVVHGLRRQAAALSWL